jgi:DNA-binding NtrC family response regulator
MRNIEMKGPVRQGAEEWRGLGEVQPPDTDDHEHGMPRPIRRKAILVVDDDPEMGTLLMEIFCLNGYEIHWVENGEVALEKLQQCTYDLIVSDLWMPKVNGPMLYRAIKQSHPQLARRFIFLSAEANMPGGLEFLERTGLPFVPKPFSLGVIRQAVRDVLEGNQQA